MTAFAVAINTLFADPNIGAAATYTPDGGSAVSCRVIWRANDANFDPYATGMVNPVKLAEVRKSEVASPAEGDTLTVAGSTYTVAAVREPDPLGLTWRLEVH